MIEPSTQTSFNGKRCVIATMHHKEAVIAPLIEEAFGVHTFVPENFDTDQFGTFTRTVKRTGNQLEAARAKAQAAMDISGCTLGVASEGSFAPHPDMPFLTSNLELVLFIDKERNLEVAGHFRSPDVIARGQEVHSLKEALEQAKKWGFPKQGLIVRHSKTSSRGVHKEITNEAELESLCKRLLSNWFRKSIYLETDMRAHRAPARMLAIKEATKDLIKNYQSECPECSTPGFVVTQAVKGLPCEACGYPTDNVKELVYSCSACNHSQKRAAQNGALANPGECIWCNP